MSDKLCLGITITLLLVYMGLAVYVQLQIPFTSIGKPQNGHLCPNQLIKLNNDLHPQCIDSCQESQPIKHLQLHNHLAKNQIIAYNDLICLPTAADQFKAIESHVQQPFNIMISQTLRNDVLVPVFATFFTLTIVYLIIAFYPSYSEIIIKFLNNSYLISLLFFLALTFNQFITIEEAQQILTSKDNEYDQFQIDAIFRLNILSLPYMILIGCAAFLLVVSTIDFSIHSIDLSTFPLTHWFSMKYYYNHFTQRVNWILVCIQAMNFIVFYLIFLHALSISEENQENLYGSLSILSIPILIVGFLLFVYLTLTICVLSEYSVYCDGYQYFTHIGSAGIQAGYLMLYSLPLLSNVIVSYFSNNRALQYHEKWLHLTSLQKGLEIIRGDNDLQLQKHRIKIYFKLNIIVNRCSLGIAILVMLGLILFTGSQMPAILFSSFLIYSIGYIYLFPLVMGSLRQFDNLIKGLIGEYSKEFEMFILYCRIMNYDITLLGSFQYKKFEQAYRNSPYSGFRAYPILVAFIFLDQRLLHIIILTLVIILSALLKQKYALIFRILLLVQQFYVPEQFRPLVACVANQIYVPYWPWQLIFFLLSIRTINGLYGALFYAAVSRSIEIQKRKLFRQLRVSENRIREQQRILDAIPQSLLIIDENMNTLYCNREVQFSEESKKILSATIRRNQQALLKLDRIEYQFKPQNEVNKLIQLQFPCGNQPLFEELDQQIDQLYNQLCQDYQKWNNLRGCKVVKESDLCNLASCTTDCRLLMHQMETMNNLINDLNFKSLRYEKTKFYMKNYVINLIESMINKLQEHFDKINLFFETGIPEYVIGDKDDVLYTLYSLLLSATLSPSKQEKLDIAVRIASVSIDKSGYDLEFQISFPSSPKHIRFYTHGECSNLDEQLIYCMVNKCKQDFLVELKLDSENLIIIYTTHISWQVKDESASIDNIQMADLNFTKNVIDSDHFSWKSKPLLEKSNRSPLTRTTFKLTFSEQLSALQQSARGQSIQNLAKSENSGDVINSPDQLSQPAMFPEIQEEIVQLVEDTLLEAYKKGLIDHETLFIDIISDDRGSQVYAESVQEPNECEFTTQDELLFATPQTKPRELKSLEEKKRKQKLLKLQRHQQEKISHKKTINEKQLNLLFSPSVMSKFSNNLVMLTHTLYWKSSKLLESRTPLTNQKFNTKILEERKNALPQKWSHKVQANKIPVQCPEILCLIPNTQYISAARRYGNSQYGNKFIKEPIITYDTTELIQVYKEYFQQSKLFCFILIYIHKQQTILELSQAIKNNESQWLNCPEFKQTTLIGLYNQIQLNKNLYQYLKYAIPLNQDDEQLRKSKEWIASICQ